MFPKNVESTQNKSLYMQDLLHDNELFTSDKEFSIVEDFSGFSVLSNYDSVVSSLNGGDVNAYYQNYINKLMTDLTVLKPNTVSNDKILEMQKEIQAAQKALKSLDDSIFGAVNSEKTIVTESISEYSYNSSQINGQEKAYMTQIINSLGVVSPKVIDAIIESIGEIKVSTTKNSTDDEVNPQILASIKSQIQDKIFNFYQTSEMNGGYKTNSGEFISVDEIIPAEYKKNDASENVSYLNNTQEKILSKVIAKSYNLETNFSALRNMINEMIEDWKDVGQDAANIDLQSYINIAKGILNEIKLEGVNGAEYDKMDTELKNFEEKVNLKNYDRYEMADMMGTLSVQSYLLDMSTVTYTDAVSYSEKTWQHSTREQISELMPDFITLDDGTKAVVDDEVIDFAYAQLLTLNCTSKKEVEDLIQNDSCIKNKTNLVDKLWNDITANTIEEKKHSYIQSISDALTEGQDTQNDIILMNIKKEVKEITKEVPEITSKSVDTAYLASKQASFKVVDLNYVRDSVKNAYLKSHGPQCTCWVHSPVTRTKINEMADAVENSFLKYQQENGSFLIDTPVGVSVENFIKDVTTNSGIQNACGASKEGIVNDHLFNPDKYDLGAQFQNIEYNGALAIRHIKNSDDSNSLANQMKDLLMTNVNRNNNNLFSEDVAQYLTEVSLAILENYYVDGENQELTKEEYFISNLNSYLNPEEKQGSVFFENYGAVLDFSKNTGVANQIVNSGIFNQLASNMSTYTKLEKEIAEKSTTMNFIQTNNNASYAQKLNQLANIQEIASTYNLSVDFSAMEDSLLKIGNSDETSVIDNLTSYFGNIYKSFVSKLIPLSKQINTIDNKEPIDYSNIDNETPKETDNSDIYGMNLLDLNNTAGEIIVEEKLPLTSIIPKTITNTETDLSNTLSKSDLESNLFTILSSPTETQSVDSPEIIKETVQNKLIDKKIDFNNLFKYTGFSYLDSTNTELVQNDVENIFDSICWELNLSTSLSFSDKYNILNGIDSTLDQDIIERKIKNNLASNGFIS